jgi:hypothetical protein
MSSLIRRLAPIFWLACLVSVVVAQGEETDPVMNYYWDHARSAAPQYNPNVPGVSYSYRAKTYRYSVTSEGITRKTDSIEQAYFYRDGKLDSVRYIRGKADRFKNLDLTYPVVFENRYHLNFYPNDAGGSKLAIGMLSDSTLGSQPDGLVLIDRNRYFLRSLYLYYPEKSGFRRFSRSFRFTVVDDFVFPDSVWEVATKLGIFYAESYRLETGISDIRVERGDTLR